MTTISATTVLRSRNADRPDKVLSTLLLRYPRFIHAEFMTHRAFSRNAASSRAVPVSKLIADVRENPVVPLHWGKNQPGMQASEETSEKITYSLGHTSGGVFKGFNEYAQTPTASWLRARDMAVQMAQAFHDAGYHKQIVNRLLEPFAHITVLVSATEWDNFLELRDHPDAEPHIAMLAREIRACLEREDDIVDLAPGEWHMPFISDEERASFVSSDLVMLSTARCASTSYKTVDGFDMTLERATAVYHKLIDSHPMHASPAEHVAMADRWVRTGPSIKEPHWLRGNQHGNFHGFRQLRHMLA